MFGARVENVMEQTLLDTLLIQEISGVDDPANQLPGWMVTKSATAEGEAAPSIVAKIKGVLLGAPDETEDINMEKQELLDALAETHESLVKSVAEAVAEAVSKSVAPADGEGAAEATPTEAEQAPAITAEDVAKAVTEATEEITKSYNEILEKVLDRVEGIEKALGIAARKSLDGQEANEGDEGVEKSAPKTPDLGDAIAAALKR